MVDQVVRILQQLEGAKAGCEVDRARCSEGNHSNYPNVDRRLGELAGNHAALLPHSLERSCDPGHTLRRRSEVCSCGTCLTGGTRSNRQVGGVGKDLLKGRPRYVRL